jgi:serine/threonine protein phosphatase PrpC
MDHFMWVVALTRVISAVFRKGGDITFLTEELKAIFDPQGGYYKPGGRFMPSLVAEIGDVIEMHLKTIGLLHPDEMPTEQRQYLEQKKQEYFEATNEVSTEEGFPSTAELCQKCLHKAVVKLDGCMTCLNCGDSKCG